MTWQDTVQAYFPKATPGPEVTDQILSKMETEYGADRKTSLLATSLCSDDINVTSTGLTEAMFGPFVLGGLGGLPFAGATGMTAYAHHIPDAGTAFIFYGPHIGITQAGELGRMYRPGQAAASNSCGALMLALSRFQNEDPENPYVPASMDIDFQQTALERAVMPYKQQVLAAAQPKKEITDVTYQLIHKQIKQLIELTKKEFHGERIVLLGGVIINTDPGEDDWVDVRHVEHIELTS